MTDTNRKAWFGPKRVGWGYRPQTWQGRVLVAIVLAVIVLGTVLLLR